MASGRAFATILALSTVPHICNSADPESGGLFIPAFSTGGSLATYPNGSTTLFCTRNKTDLGNRFNDGCVPPPTDLQPMAALYFILLLWVFLGVGIVSDIFMAAIEAITSVSKWVETKDSDGRTQQVEVRKWNATVANLTLMALGSSAPEILLSCIEMFSHNFYAGDLGPGTIVGSAAFNMFIIIGVCVSCIPKKNLEAGETGYRKIEETGVYGITAFSSIFAYLWLLIILLGPWSPNLVEWWEALITLLMFPGLVGISYMADAGWFRKKKIVPTDDGADEEDAMEEFGKPSQRASLTGTEASLILQKKGLKKLSTKAALSYLTRKIQPRSRAFHRMTAQQKISGGAGGIGHHNNDTEASSPDKLTPGATAGNTMAPLPTLKSVRTDTNVGLGFTTTQNHALEGDGHIELIVSKTVRAGKEDVACSINYTTLAHDRTKSMSIKPQHTSSHDSDMTATSVASVHESEGEDPAATVQRGKLDFALGEMEKRLIVKVPDHGVSTNYCLRVRLSEATKGAAVEQHVKTCTIRIHNKSSPGTIALSETTMGKAAAEYITHESDGFVHVKVLRLDGHSGTVSVDYKTKEGSAMSGTDYKHIEGTLEFAHGEVEKVITIELVQTAEYERDEHFLFTLSNVKGGAVLGGLVTAIITIKEDESLKLMGNKVVQLMAINMDRFRLGASNWKDQFSDAVTIPDNCSVMTKVICIITIPWKVIFALVPPTTYNNGVATFFCSLGMITFVTILIGDFASLFGCALGLKDAITAITFVALGTSLPDTFASTSAAIGDETADNSVGNVTGSNSVNVFLGLGTPWFIASMYWMYWGATPQWIARYPAEALLYPSGGFVVQSGDLGFSVIVFSCCAVICLATLSLRRKLTGAELGGPNPIPFTVLYVLLWFVYIALSILKVEGLV